MKILTVMLILMFILAPVSMANTSYTYTLTHDIELELDGEFDFKSNVSTPSQGTVDIELDGVGKAYLKSNLSIIESSQISTNWYDLF